MFLEQCTSLAHAIGDACLATRSILVAPDAAQLILWVMRAHRTKSTRTTQLLTVFVDDSSY